MTTLGLAILIFLCILFIFVIINRICECIERCAYNKALSTAFIETTKESGTKEDD